MAISNAIIVIALGLLVFYQQWFFTREIQKLIDKLMSRNFAEYQQVVNPPPQEPPRINLNDEPQEDLRVLG